MDLAAGIMIIWVLYFHALYPMLGNAILDKVPWLFFFMPWFFYKSGLFFCPGETKGIIKKDAHKLLRAFVIWSAIGYVARIIHFLAMGQDFGFREIVYSPLRSLFLEGSIPMNTAVWFLPVLFFVRQIANWGLKRIHPVVIMLFSGMVSITLHYLNWRFFPAWISNTIWGLFFFSAGYYLKDKESNLILIVCSFAITLWALFFTTIPAKYCHEVSFTEFVLWYPVCIFGCIAFDNLCKWVNKAQDSIMAKMQKKKKRHTIGLFEYVGQNALIFYVSHYILFRITFDWIARYNSKWYSGWEGLMIITFIYAIVIFPICRFLNHRDVKNSINEGK